MTEILEMTNLSQSAKALLSLIENRQATIAVVGLGYVGLPLARAMHDAGFPVIGFDLDTNKVRMLRDGQTYLHHLGEELVAGLQQSDRFEPTSDEQRLAAADVIILCVPTPIGRHNEPDMSFIVSSTEMVARHLRPGQMISLESTTYPGTSRGDCLPILERTGLRCGEDFFVAYSPEREDPGRANVTTQTIPKLVGGLDPQSTMLAYNVYSAAIRQVIAVDSAEIAEAAKLLENIYRAVNIALVNELKPVLADMGIDVWKVIAAAATKPFGFQAFYPGPGLGGHCIPIDPFYLTWKAREFGHHTRFIELAGEINSSMPGYVVRRCMHGLNQAGRALSGAKILILGVAYKADIDDMRETPAAEIIHQLADAGAKVTYHDPHVAIFPSMRRHDFDMQSVPLTPERLRSSDAVIIVTDHKAIDWAAVAEHAPLIIDARNAMEGRAVRGKVVKA